MESRIGKYQIKAELGRGRSSVVYLAFDEFLNAELAVKVYLPNDVPAHAMTANAQFISEQALSGRLIHPHIVTIIDAYAEGDLRYVAMEHVPGGNLQAYTRPEHLLPVADVIEIAFKCCGALDYAHRQGVVHRDIKPSNILRTSGTDVKLADFGAAFVADVISTQEFRLSSPAYTPPEQILGDEPTHHGDMFSLGVMLYELFTGTRPFRGDSAQEILDRVVSLPVEPPTVRRPDLPRQIDSIVLRMLEKSPANRYPTWAEAALALVTAGRLSVYDHEIADSEKFIALRRSTFLRSLGEGELWEAARHGEWRRLPAQHVIVTEGDRGDSLFVLARGSAKVLLKGKLLDLLRPGDGFGDVGFALGPDALRSATIQTTTDVIVVEFPRSTIERLPASSQLKLSLALLRVMAQRLAFTSERLVREATA